MTAEKKACQNCKTGFEVAPEDLEFYKRISVPPPTFCPDCRLQRRLAWRNERTLHRQVCALCGEKILSVFHKDSGLTVYCYKCWWSDKWDAADQAMEADLSRPFLEQFMELLRRTPLPNLFRFEPNMVNSEYCNMANDLKDCYLLHNATFSEGALYGSAVFSTKDSADVTMARQCELCYEVINCIKCHRVFFSEDCESCNDVYFSKDLKGCNNCFGCSGLRNKSYHIFNEPYSKEEYEQKLAGLVPGSFQAQEENLKKARELWQGFPRKYMHGTQNTGVSGDYVNNSKNAQHCFDVANIEDSKFCALTSNGPIQNTYDFTHYGDNVELVCEGLQMGDGVSGARFSWFVLSNALDVDHSAFVIGSAHMFGCVGMRKKEYCILNKQYPKEEYEKIVPRIIEQMNQMPYQDSGGRAYGYGEFFPAELSPFAYNETTAQEYFRLSEEEVFTAGCFWREPEKRDYEVTKKWEDLPDSIDQVDEDILKETISCAHGGKCNENCATAFRILPAELQLYGQLRVALPRLCPSCRHFQRLRRRNSLRLWPRQCGCAGRASGNGSHKNTTEHFHAAEPCPNQFQTTYAPDRPEIVYCEQCYQAEVA